jgi:hypothetical protein
MPCLRNGAANHCIHLYDPSFARYRFAKSMSCAPVDSADSASVVGARSSGWTKSRNGVERSSSSECPSTVCQAGLTRTK